MAFKKIGLALSGGGARGLAHIGILQVFGEAGIPIFVLSGTSMGGLIAAAYAAGFDIAELERRALTLSHYRELVKLLDVSPLRRGFLEGNRVREYLTRWFGETLTFEELKYPLALCATDLNSSQCVTLTSGNLLTSVLATIAVPGLFAPVQIGPHHLVDGGVLNNLPVMAARDLGADLVIAVDVQISPTLSPPWQELPYKPKWPVPLPDFFLDLYRAGLIMVEKITQNNLEKAPPDLLIQPSMPEDITMFLGFHRAPEILEAGRVAARSYLPQILSTASV